MFPLTWGKFPLAWGMFSLAQQLLLWFLARSLLFAAWIEICCSLGGNGFAFHQLFFAEPFVSQAHVVLKKIHVLVLRQERWPGVGWLCVIIAADCLKPWIKHQMELRGQVSSGEVSDEPHI